MDSKSKFVTIFDKLLDAAMWLRLPKAEEHGAKN
jgi:hypothetical protein